MSATARPGHPVPELNPVEKAGRLRAVASARVRVRSAGVRRPGGRARRRGHAGVGGLATRRVPRAGHVPAQPARGQRRRERQAGRRGGAEPDRRAGPGGAPAGRRPGGDRCRAADGHRRRQHRRQHAALPAARRPGARRPRDGAGTGPGLRDRSGRSPRQTAPVAQPPLVRAAGQRLPQAGGGGRRSPPLVVAAAVHAGEEGPAQVRVAVRDGYDVIAAGVPCGDGAEPTLDALRETAVGTLHTTGWQVVHRHVTELLGRPTV